jgi:hypothetical protein
LRGLDRQWSVVRDRRLGARGSTEPAQDEDLAYAIGVQTYISGFPVMDLYRTLWETSFDPERGHDRTLNEYFVFERLITSEDDWVITPNNDTIYLRAFLDLRAEPIILVIPPMGDRQYWVPVSDMWHDFDANLSWDTIGARRRLRLVPARMAGRFARGRAAGRHGHADHLDAAPHRGGRRRGPAGGGGAAEAVPARPLEPVGSGQGHPAASRRGRFPALHPPRAHQRQGLLHDPQQGAPALAAPRQPDGRGDGGLAARVGMDPATGFDWDSSRPQAQRGLERAAADAHRIIAQRMPRLVPIVNNWQVVRLDKRLSGDPVFAAAAAMLGLLWNPAEISTYDVAFFDGAGAPLDGSNRYVLHFDPPPPVDGFWSVTMYSADNQLFVPNKIDRYSFGDRTKGTVYGEDGSLEIFLQHEEPTDPVERANWLPAPKGRFYLVTRHYSPQSPIMTRDWAPPAITKR